MTSTARAPTIRERENNMKRERRRRAISARIFNGLRHHGNYKLPKHCDNNEVLKALCREAGYTVEEDGTTYRKDSNVVNPFSFKQKGEMKMPEVVYEGQSMCTDRPPNSARSDWPPKSAVHGASVYSDGSVPNGNAIADANAALDANAVHWHNPIIQTSTSTPPMRRASFSAPVTPPLSSPQHRAVSKPYDVLPDLLLSKPDPSREVAMARGNAVQGLLPSKPNSCLPKPDSAWHSPASRRLDLAPPRLDNVGHNLPTPKSKSPDSSSTRTEVVAPDMVLPRAPIDVASFAPDLTPDFATFKACPFFQSSSSTPTYPMSRLVSGASTPSCFFTSGTCTPVRSSICSSGACTPTSHGSGMRALPLQFAVAISNLALSQSQEELQDDDRPASDLPQCQKPFGLGKVNSLPRHDGKAGTVATTEGLSKSAPGLLPNGYGDVCDAPVRLVAETVPDTRGALSAESLKSEVARRHGVVVKPWEGETIYEVSLGEEELELTLGSSAFKAG